MSVLVFVLCWGLIFGCAGYDRKLCVKTAGAEVCVTAQGGEEDEIEDIFNTRSEG